MDISKIEYFIKVCECENMTKAAKDLYISQPALSQSIALFEKYFGHKLFDREGRKLVLNEKGKIALKYARAIQDNLSAMRREMDEINPEFRIASCDEDILSFIVSRFIIENPSVRIFYNTLKKNNDCKQLVQEKKLDAVITDTVIADEAICNLLVFQERQYVCVPENSPFYGKYRASLSDFDGCSFIRESGSESPHINHLIQQKKLDLHIEHLEFKIIKNLRGRIDKYYFMSTIGNLIITNAFPSDKKRLVRLTDSELTHDYYISFLKKHSASTEIFLQWLTDNYTSIFR